jgi:hypothetical protein
MAKSNTKDDRNDLPPPYTPQPLYPQQVPIGKEDILSRKNFDNLQNA